MSAADKKIAVQALGCKVNFADMQALAARLEAEPGRSIVLVGTCCVTAEGEKQSRKEVRRALRQVGEKGRVIVAGCSARLHPEVYSSMGENVRVADASGPGTRLSGPGLSESPGVDAPAGSRRTRFFLKVQDGCANMCSYCVIPQVRGRPQSLPAPELLDQARLAVAAGYPELVVTGINTGSYSWEGMSLAALLDGLAGVDGLKRLRLSSVEAPHVSPELLDVIGLHPLIGRHLHLPLQSGDDRVLAAMGRRYTVADFLKITDMARQAISGINLTTDVIAGFPAEDEAALVKTMNAVEHAGFSRVHVFIYSARPGTRAASLGDPVSPQEKKLRGGRLRALSESLQGEHRRRKLGEVNEILLESPQGPAGHGGYSSDYTRYMVEGGSQGELVKVRGELVMSEGIWGKVSEAETA